MSKSSFWEVFGWLCSIWHFKNFRNTNINIKFFEEKMIHPFKHLTCIIKWLFFCYKAGGAFLSKYSLVLFAPSDYNCILSNHLLPEKNKSTSQVYFQYSSLSSLLTLKVMWVWLFVPFLLIPFKENISFTSCIVVILPIIVMFVEKIQKLYKNFIIFIDFGKM